MTSWSCVEVTDDRGIGTDVICAGARLCRRRALQLRLPGFHQPPAKFQPAHRGTRRRSARCRPAAGGIGSLPDHAQHHPRPPARRPPFRIRISRHIDRRFLEPDVWPGPGDDLAGLRLPVGLSRFPRSIHSGKFATSLSLWAFARVPEWPGGGGKLRMPFYKLDGQAPEVPGEGQYFVAETAVLIGRVRLKAEASVWFGAVLRGDNEWIELGER